MDQFSTLQTNCQHYDSRFDGNIRFKMIFRSNIYGEPISNASFSKFNFTSIYIDKLDSKNNIPAGTPLNLSLQIFNFNNNSAFIQPLNQSYQDKIEVVEDGYYFLIVSGKDNLDIAFTMVWQFSIFNSDLDS
jgi:hypothetical protein